MKNVMRRLGLAIAALGVVAGTAGQAEAGMALDFATYADGTHLSSAASITFSLKGGEDSSGSPTIFRGGLSNSNTGDYPTAAILDFAFSGPVNNVSFVFNNEGLGSVGGRGDSFFQAFGAGGVLLEQGSLSGASRSTFNLASSGITNIQFNNSTGGDSNWVFEVNSIAWTPAAVATPEPSSVALVCAALPMGLGLAWKRRRKTLAV